MTYKELAEKIWAMTDEQRRMTVTVHVQHQDEFYGVQTPLQFIQPDEDNAYVLDESHPYLVI